MIEQQLLQGSFHCGAVRITLPAVPETARAATAPCAGGSTESGRTTNLERSWSRDTRKTQPSTPGATRRCEPCVARPAGALRTGSHLPQSLAAGMASTLTTSIRVFQAALMSAVSMARTRGHSWTERHHRSVGGASRPSTSAMAGHFGKM